MNKREAIKAMLEGKKVYNKINKNEYLFINNEGYIYVNSCCTQYFAIINDYPVDGWEIYKETKKVDKWLWAYFGGRKWYVTESFYGDNEDMHELEEFSTTSTKCIKLEATKITVEEEIDE